MTRKEELYIIAIQNLQKKIEVLQLYNQLETGGVNQEELDKEISENESKYVINISSFTNKKDMKIINEIIDNVGYKDLNYDDVAEIFGIDFLIKKI